MAIDEVGSMERSSARARTKAFPVHGLWVPTLTPVDRDLAPDTGRLVTHVRALLEDGCHGIVLFGTTGEAPSFSVTERMALLDAVLDAGIPADRVMFGTGCPSLTDAVDLTVHGVRSGCAGILVVPPYFFKTPSEDGVFSYYAELIERTGTDGLRLYLYNFPRLSGVPITPSLIARLCDRYPGTIAGVKDSSGDWVGTRALIAEFPDLAIFPGSESFLLSALEEGGAGCITATANINSRAIRAVFDAWMSESHATGSLQDRINAVRTIVQNHPLPPALKYIVAHRRRDPAWRTLRPPFVPLDEVAGERLLSELRQADFEVGPE